MFKQPEKGEFETIIGPSVKVEGDFVGEGNVIVEGLVNGSLKTSKSVVVSENAKITANIMAGSAKVAGEVNGNIKVQDRLDLAATAKVLGDIEANIITIEAGAKFNGKCSMNDKAEKGPITAKKPAQ